MPTKLILATAVLALTVTPNLDAQAMIGYGHQVAKAGAIGAAVGSGLAGGLTKVGTTLEGPSVRKHSPLRRVKKSSTMTTGANGTPGSGKIVISGGAFAQTVRADDSEASADGAEGTGEVLEARAAKPAAGDAEERTEPVFDTSTPGVSPSRGAAQSPAKAEATDELAAVEQTDELESAPTSPTAASGNERTAVAEGSSNAQVVGESLDSAESQVAGRQASDAVDTQVLAAAEAPEPVPAANPFTVDQVEIGGSVQNIIASIGRPATSIYGLAGINYSEKYFFKMDDGRRMVVLAISGVITRVGVS